MYNFHVRVVASVSFSFVTPRILLKLASDELGYSETELKPFKRNIKQMALAFLEQARENIAPEVGDGEVESEVEEEEEEVEVNRSPVKKIRKEKKKKKGKVLKEPKVANHSKVIAKAKGILKTASIRIPVNVFAKNKTIPSLECALEELLGKHGLSLSSSAKQIRGVRKKLEIARDLDGIDLSNVMTSGRRGRSM